MKHQNTESSEDLASLGEAAELATGSLDRFADEIQNAGIFDRTDIQNPLDIIEYKRGKIEKDFEGSRGLLNRFWGSVGAMPTYNDLMDELTQAASDYSRGDIRDQDIKEQQRRREEIESFVSGMDAAVNRQGMTASQRAQSDIEAQYQKQITDIDKLSQLPLSDFGFKNKEELDELIGRMKQDAAATRTWQENRIEDSIIDRKLADEGELEVLRKQGAGDSSGAERQKLENEFNAEEWAVDPNDREQLSRLQGIHQQALNNFDAQAARQKKLQQDQSDDEVAKFQEEKHESELRSQGKDDQAEYDRLKFTIEQRTKSLREQADAEADPVRKAQLEREADASASAEQSDLDALRKQQQRESQSATQNLAAPPGSANLTPALADAVKKLDDAATKLDKALSKAKNIVVLKD